MTGNDYLAEAEELYQQSKSTFVAGALNSGEARKLQSAQAATAALLAIAKYKARG